MWICLSIHQLGELYSHFLALHMLQSWHLCLCVDLYLHLQGIYFVFASKVAFKKNIFIYWFTSQLATRTAAEPQWNQEPRTPSRSPICMTGAQTFRSSSSVFQGALAGGRIGSRAVRNWTGARVRWQGHKQQLMPLCHDARPLFAFFFSWANPSKWNN